MRKYIVAAILAGTVATPALAQDASGPFSGVRVEGIVGYDTTDVEGDGSNGILYGAGVGYDFQAGNLIVGIEGEATDSTIDECVDGAVIATDTLCAKFGRDLYVGGRIGGQIGSNALLYAKAGYTNARVAIDYEDGTAGTVNDFNIGDELDGLRVGGGLEFAIGTNAYAKAEYRYSNYEQGFDKHQGVVGFGFRF
jgi:outer membrane immunogenic protein